jgi:hypothetical protein
VDIVPDGAESVEPVSLAVGPKVGGNEGRSRLGGRCRLVPAHSSLGRQVRDGRDPRAPTAACDCPLSSLLRRLRSVRVRWVILVGSRSGGCQGVLANTGPRRAATASCRPTRSPVSCELPRFPAADSAGEPVRQRGGLAGRALLRGQYHAPVRPGLRSPSSGAGRLERRESARPSTGVTARHPALQQQLRQSERLTPIRRERAPANPLKSRRTTEPITPATPVTLSA